MARRRGVRWLGLGVDVDNPEAGALYERLGYTRTGIVSRTASTTTSTRTALQQHAVEWDEYMIKESSGDDPVSALTARGARY